MAGIYRSVHLMATPKAHIRDFAVRTNLDDRYRNAELEVIAQMSLEDGSLYKGNKVEVALYDDSGRSVLKEASASRGRRNSASTRPMTWSTPLIMRK